MRLLDRLVDGLHGETVWNFLGCFWHGCPRCYTQRDLKNAVNGKTMMTLHNETLRFEAALRDAGYTCLLYTSPSPRDRQKSRMPSSA